MPGANMLILVIYSFLLRKVTNKTSGGKKRNGRETNEKEGVKMTGVHIL